MAAEVIQQKTGKIFYWFGLLFIFWLPLDNSFIPLFSFLWLFSGLIYLLLNIFISGRYMFNKSNIKLSYILLFMAFYFLHIISVLYSENQSSALFELEIKLPLLFFPFFVVKMLTIDSQKRLDNLLMAFVLGNFTAVLIDFGVAIWGHDQFEISHFFYRELSYFHHPSYFALYLAFSIAILLFRFLPRYDLSKSLVGNLLILLSALFFVFVLLLSSRAGIIAVLLIPVFKIIQLLTQSRIHKLFKISIIMTALLLMILLVSTNTRVQQAYNSFAGNFDMEEVRGQKEFSSGQTRIIVWKSSLELIKQNWLFGIGNGDVKQAINKKSTEILGSDIQLKRQYNAHNQFLDTFLALGILGLFMLLIIIFWPGIIAVRQNNYLLLSLVLLLIIQLSFESMINRQAGVVFFSFFLPLLFGMRFSKRT